MSARARLISPPPPPKPRDTVELTISVPQATRLFALLGCFGGELGLGEVYDALEELEGYNLTNPVESALCEQAIQIRAGNRQFQFVDTVD